MPELDLDTLRYLAHAIGGAILIVGLRLARRNTDNDL